MFEMSQKSAQRIQATWRGQAMRRHMYVMMERGLGVKWAKHHDDDTHEATLREKMAKYLYPNRNFEDRIAALSSLEDDLAKRARKKRLDAAAKAAAEPPEVSPVEKATAEATQAAVLVQARMRGVLGRQMTARLASELSAAEEKTGRAAIPKKETRLVMLGWLMVYLLGAVSMVFVLGVGVFALAHSLPGVSRILLYVAGIVLNRLLLLVLWLLIGLYCWLRLPYWLGKLTTHLLTNLPLHTYPIGFETIRVAPWLSYNPLTIHVDVDGAGFYMNNPAWIQCRDPHLIRVDHCHIIASTELGFLKDLIKGKGLKEPLLFTFQQIIITGVAFNMMLGKNGELNLVAMQKVFADNEIKEAIGGVYVFPYKKITLPNVIRMRIVAARNLIDLPNLKPRVEVTMRDVKLSTACGKRVDGEELGRGGFQFEFDTEMVIPCGYDFRDGVLIVRVYNDNVSFGRSPILIGQWFMTVKYLIMFPMYCKHKEGKLTAHGDGAISGTFLLTDAKFQGSACRALGCNDLGRGLSGELDMEIHYTHSDLIDPLPPVMEGYDAIGQLGKYPLEDKCKLGNMAELKAVLSGLPMLFDIEFFLIRKAYIEMSDLFVGAKKNKLKHHSHSMHIKQKYGVVPKLSSDGTTSGGSSSGESPVSARVPAAASFASDGKMKKKIKATSKSDEQRIYIESLNLTGFNKVNFYELLDNLQMQMFTRAAFDVKALGTATAEVFSGIGTNVARMCGFVND